jgi:type I restriction-modification system DNA methylase subunit
MLQKKLRSKSGCRNDIPDLLKKWEAKPESERSWYTTRKEIEENDLNLTAGRYKTHVHEELEYPEPETIITEVLEIEEKIGTGLKRLMEKVKE